MASRLSEHRLRDHLARIFPENALPGSNADAVSDTTGAAAVVGPAGEGGRALAQENAGRHRWIAEAGRQEQGKVRWGYRRMADWR